MIANLIISLIGEITGDFFKSKADKERFEYELSRAINNSQDKLLQTQRDIIVAEVESKGPASTWRPHLMYLIMFLLVFNGVIVPLVNAFFNVEVPVLEAWQAIPESLWDVLMLGIGGYVVGRSGEKIAKEAFKK